MNKLFFIILLSLLSIYGSGQVTFQKTFGGLGNDWGISVEQTVNGEYVIAGHTDGFGAGNQDYFLMKVDDFGNIMWIKTYGGPDDDRCYSMIGTSDGGYILTGYTNSFGQFADTYVVKTDSNGDTLWTRTYGGTGVDFGMSIEEVTGGGYIIAGRTTSYGAGSIDVYLIRIDSLGNIIWAKTYGGGGDEEGFSIQQTFDGGFIVSGRIGQGFAGIEIYVVKTDSAGNILWAKVYGEAEQDEAFCIQQTSDSGYVIAGATSSFGLGWARGFLLKINSAGDTLWMKTYGALTEMDYLNSVKQTPDGGYIATGALSSLNYGYTLYTIKTDANGDTLWTKIYGTDYGSAIQLTQDSGYILIGSTKSMGNGYDIYFIKTDAAGNSGCNEGFKNIIVKSVSPMLGSGAFSGSGGIMGYAATVVTNPQPLDSLLCLTIIDSNSEEINDNWFHIYPNPASEHFTIIGNFALPAVIELYDIMGRKVHWQQVTSNRQQIKVGSLAAGLYVYRLASKGKEARGKIILE